MSAWRFECEHAVGSDICLDPLHQNSGRELTCDASDPRGGYLIGSNHRCVLKLFAQGIDSCFSGVKQ